MKTDRMGSHSPGAGSLLGCLRRLKKHANYKMKDAGIEALLFINGTSREAD
jgi:hypothetical protein